MRLPATALALFPTLAWAEAYDGTYRQAANADCANVGQDGGALKIEAGIFYGVEVQCRMSRPVNVTDMDATLYTMICSNADQSWTERAMLMLSGESDGIIMVWNGYAFKYDRCPPATVTATSQQ